MPPLLLRALSPVQGEFRGLGTQVLLVNDTVPYLVSRGQRRPSVSSLHGCLLQLAS